VLSIVLFDGPHLYQGWLGVLGTTLAARRRQGSAEKTR
jgi:hypothetical protein